MDISETGLKLIKSFEGLHKAREDGRIESYLCPAGVWTIGWGTTRNVTKDMIISKDQAEMLFVKDLAVFEDAVERLVKVSLSQSQFDALVSFTYNVGISALSKSTLLTELNKGNYDSVPGQLSRWVKVTINGKKITLKGLVRRRKAEMDLWNEDKGIELIGQPLPQSIEPETGKATEAAKKSLTIWGAFIALFGTIGGYAADLFSFAGDVITETQNKLTLTDTLYKLLTDNMKEVFIVVAVIGAMGVVLRRIQAAKEKKEG